MGKGKPKHASPNEDYSTFVEHPRYGTYPHITGLNVFKNKWGDNYSHWHSPVECRIPNTAVPANTTKQRPATVHVTHYFDVIRKCVDCGRKFIFFAEEQKFWYETLKFPLAADCIRCCDCRRTRRESNSLRERYAILFQIDDPSDEELLQLLDCAIRLKERGDFGDKVIELIRHWKNRLAKNEKIHKQKTFTDLVDRLDRLVAN